MHSTSYLSPMITNVPTPLYRWTYLNITPLQVADHVRYVQMTPCITRARNLGQCFCIRLQRVQLLNRLLKNQRNNHLKFVFYHDVVYLEAVWKTPAFPTARDW